MADPAENDEDDDGFPDPVDPTEEAEEAKKPTGDEAEATALSEALVQSMFEETTRLKDAGNSKFKAGDNVSAIATYNDALGVADGATTDSAKDMLKPVLISLHNNSAAAHIKLEAWEAAEESASKVLELDAPNSKALFRRGLARSRLGQLSSAQADLLAACKADPKDRSARAELATVQAALKTQRESLKSSFSAKFGAAAEKAVAREEAREAARKEEEARQKAAAEAKLREEWKGECARLRQVQAAQREQTRRARLRRFLGEDVDVSDDAAATADSGKGQAAAVADAATAAADGTWDLSAWARAALSARLLACACEAGGVAVAVTSVRRMEGSASSSLLGAHGGRFFEFGFRLEWRARSTAAAGGAQDGATEGAEAAAETAPAAEATGELVYAEVMAAADGSGVNVGEVNHTIREEPEGEGAKGEEAEGEGANGEGEGAKPAALPETDTLAALDVLRTVVSDALEGFVAALEAQAPPAAEMAAAPAAAPAETADGSGGAEPMEVDEPISFEEYKQQKEAAAKAEKERHEAAEKAAKAEADEARRRARKAEKVVVDNEEGLDMRGYKIRADGTKTSYFDRQVLATAPRLPQRAPACPSERPRQRLRQRSRLRSRLRRICVAYAPLPCTASPTAVAAALVPVPSRPNRSLPPLPSSPHPHEPSPPLTALTGPDLPYRPCRPCCRAYAARRTDESPPRRAEATEAPLRRADRRRRRRQRRQRRRAIRAGGLGVEHWRHVGGEGHGRVG